MRPMRGQPVLSVRSLFDQIKDMSVVTALSRVKQNTIPPHYMDVLNGLGGDY